MGGRYARFAFNPRLDFNPRVDDTHHMTTNADATIKFALRRFPTDVPRIFTDPDEAAAYWLAECNGMPVRVISSVWNGEGPGLYAEVKPILDAAARITND